MEAPTRSMPSMNATTASTVENSAIAPIQIQPPAGNASAPPISARDEERRRGAGGDERAEQERVDPRDDALGDEDVDRVRRARAERQRDAGRLEAAGPAAEQHERGARAGEQEGERLPGRDVLAAQRDGPAEHERGIGVEQQRRQRHVDVAQRREEQAGLGGVADRAEPEGGEDHAPSWAGGGAGERAAAGAPCAHGDDRPQQRRGQHEARGEQRRHAEPGGVGLLGEDRHEAEADGRHEAQRDAGAAARIRCCAGRHAGGVRRSQGATRHHGAGRAPRTPRSRRGWRRE